MIPSVQTVLRSRYAARVVIRVVAGVGFAYAAWDAFDFIRGLVQSSGDPLSILVNWLLWTFAPWLARLAVPLALLLWERRLVRWLIPMPWRGCPVCGYETPTGVGRCPECGLDLSKDGASTA
jgi:hypothetical protein